MLCVDKKGFTHNTVVESANPEFTETELYMAKHAMIFGPGIFLECPEIRPENMKDIRKLIDKFTWEAINCDDYCFVNGHYLHRKKR